VAAVSFASPAWLAALVALPVLVWAYLVGRSHSTRYAARFPAVSTLALAARAEGRWRRHLPAALVLAACAALVLALARPHHTVRVPVGSASVVLVLDHSGSMEATDVQPTRLAAAKRAAHAFIDELPSHVRVGVVAFSTVPDGIQDPTFNRPAALRVIDAQAAGGSTATGNALQLALQLLATANVSSAAPGGSGKAADPPPKKTPGAIVLLSDGAANAGTDPVEVATQAGARGIPIYTVALGTPGATIPDPSGFGPPVPVPPDPELLAQIASASHGHAFTAQDEDHLISTYRHLAIQLTTVPRSRDITADFALAGALLLLLGGIAALRRGGALP
jgi:Ca-activated chloride channel family protein